MDGLWGSLVAGAVGGAVALLLQAGLRALRTAVRQRATRTRAVGRIRKRFWIRLTPEQKAEIKLATGEELEALGYSEEELMALRRAPKLPREKHLHGLWVALGLDD